MFVGHGKEGREKGGGRILLVLLKYEVKKICGREENEKD